MTGREVATLAGVSRTTVSLVLNGREAGHVGSATKERVQDAARALGYVPDAAGRYLVSGRTRTLGLAVGEAQLREDPFVSWALGAVAAEARRAGFALTVDAVPDPSVELDRLIRAGQVDGLIALAAPGAHAGLLRLLGEGAAVAVIGDLPERRDACTGPHGHGAACAAVRHLLRAGRRRVAHLAQPPSGFGADARRAGYLQALTEGSSARPLERCAACTPAGGHLGMRALLAAEPRLDAVFCASDAAAAGALVALRETGRSVPDDVAVVGFDDLPHARFTHPRLSTVRTDPQAHGRAAARYLLARMEADGASPDGGPLEEACPAPKLIVRRSCGTGPRPGGAAA